MLMNFKNITLSEKKPDSEGHILCDFPYMKCLQQVNPQRQKVNQWLPGVRSEWGVQLNGYGVSFWDENVGVLDRSDGCTTL